MVVGAVVGFRMAEEGLKMYVWYERRELQSFWKICERIGGLWCSKREDLDYFMSPQKYADAPVPAMLGRSLLQSGAAPQKALEHD